MNDWLSNFSVACEKMLAETPFCSVVLPTRGRIEWLSDVCCEVCKQPGVCKGSELEYGAFYACAEAIYCPNCKKVTNSRTGINFAPHHQGRFLPVMKKKVHGISLVEREALSCPRCGSPRCRFTKDLSGLDYYVNTWEVYSNPDCSRSNHWEIYEMSGQ